jgi:signal transduction histidine kinase
MSLRKAPILFCLIFLPVLLRAGQTADSTSPLKYGFGSELKITAISGLIDTVRSTGIGSRNGASDGVSAGIEDIKNRAFEIPFDSIRGQLNRNPVRYTFWLKFGIRNTGGSVLDLSVNCGNLNYTDLFFLSPGDRIQHVRAGDLRRAPAGSSYAQRRGDCLPLRLAPGQSGEVFLELKQRTDEFNFDGIAIYDTPTLNAGLIKDQETGNNHLIFQLLFQGFLLCQLLYVFLQWLIIRRKEYLYYFFYLAVTGLYFLSKQESFFGIDLLFSRWPLLKVYLGKTLLIVPYFLYFRFVRCFLDMRVNYPALNKWVIRMENFLLAYMVFDLGLIVISFNRRLQTEIYFFILFTVFIVAAGFMVYLFRRRQTLIYYIISGSLFVATGHILGILFSYLQFVRHLDLGVTDILIWSQVGIVLEILCFTAGLSYKSEAAEKEKIKSQEKLIEQLKANELLQSRMQHIRNKIAQDLHDDIGSTLSSISILSGLALEERNSGQALETMSEIKDSSIMLMERMDDIVWSINPRNDSLENLLVRVKHFATTLFEAREINYTIRIQENIHEVKLPSDYRQHIYLVLKEAINNLVKYAKATRADILIGFDRKVLELSVKDDGCGFDTSGQSTGNGIPGMRRRAELMNAELDIRSVPGGGTEMNLTVIIENSYEYPIAGSPDSRQF